MPRLRSLLLCCAAAGALAAPATGARGAARWFVTPGLSGASCELGLNRASLHPATYAFCLEYRPGRPYSTAVAVTMDASGKLTICRGLRCLGNTPEHTPTVAAGRSIALGPFRCTSLRSGVRCVVTKLGHGFQLDSHGATRV